MKWRLGNLLVQSARERRMVMEPFSKNCVCDMIAACIASPAISRPASNTRSRGQDFERDCGACAATFEASAPETPTWVRCFPEFAPSSERSRFRIKVRAVQLQPSGHSRGFFFCEKWLWHSESIRRPLDQVSGRRGGRGSPELAIPKNASFAEGVSCLKRGTNVGRSNTAAHISSRSSAARPPQRRRSAGSGDALTAAIGIGGVASGSSPLAAQ